VEAKWERVPSISEEEDQRSLDTVGVAMQFDSHVVYKK
jgi:hypothetical protein